MWSDPEVANLQRVSMSTNQDMVRRMRLGGLFYVLCCSVIVAMSPVLRAQSYGVIFVVLFVILAVLRLIIYQQAFKLHDRNEAFIERPVSAIYIILV